MSKVVNQFNERMQILEKNVIDLNRATKEMRASIIRQPLNNYGIYSAICISTFDVWKQNRIQWFSPLFDNPKTEIESLPWAAPISSFGGFDDCGSSWVPPAGSTVLIAFENGCSGATYYPANENVDPLEDPSHLEPYANKLIETDADTYVNTSEINPMGGL